MADGNDVITAIPISESVLSLSTADNLSAVNHAIGKLWKLWRMTEKKEGGTLASSTFEYSLSALSNIHADTGIANVTITPTGDYTRDISHHFQQYYDHSSTSWTLIASSAIASKYSGYAFDVHYQYPHPQLTSLDDTVYAPIHALAANALLWFAMAGATEQNVDNAFWKAFAPEYFTGGVPIYEPIKNHHLPIRVKIGLGRS